MNSYNLTRKWFDFAFENVDKVKSQHTALYVFAVEHNNRLGWKENFQLPTAYTMECTGIGTYKTYINALNDLIKLDFIEMIKKSKNQYSANIVALTGMNQTYTKQGLSALDKAIIGSVSENNIVYNSALVDLTKAEPKQNFALVVLTKAKPKQNQSNTKAEQKQDQSKTKAEVVNNNHIPYTKNQEPKTIYQGGKIIFTKLFEETPMKNKEDFFKEILKRKDFNNFLNQNQEIGKEKITEKEKSSAKKEKETQELNFIKCKELFLANSETYYWQNEDELHLKKLLTMLKHLIEQTGTKQNLVESFQFFIKNLPPYWREKKFTIPNLSKNYNEIINEIKRKYERKNIQTEQSQDINKFIQNFGKDDN